MGVELGGFEGRVRGRRREVLRGKWRSESGVDSGEVGVVLRCFGRGVGEV